ncbi:MAG: sugar phosphate isomerase/epimerase [Bryobacterales bacterium]|nr:sugar phosphate isomerase/epimerase [Bryobacterales bacterium]
MTRRQLLFTPALAAAARRRWPLGANTAVQGYSLSQAISLIGELEFEVIEIHPMGRPQPTPKVFPGFQFDQLTALEKREIRTQLKPFKTVTTHLPYTGLNWLSARVEEKQHAVKTIDTALEGSAYFGATTAVLHPQPLTQETWKARQDEYTEAIARWAGKAAKLGVRIAVETGFPHSVDDFVSLIQTVGHGNLGATIDVGHQGRFVELASRIPAEARSLPASVQAYNETTNTILSRLGRKVFHLHVHDIDPETWVEHKPLVHNFVDYPRLYETLGRIGYKGALVLEIGGPPEQMPAHLKEARRKLRNWFS